MRPNASNVPSRWLFGVALLLILLVAAGLRLYRLPELPLGLHYDEAANGILATEIARGTKTPIFISSYTGKEVLFFYWAALWVKLLGPTPLALRLSAALVGLAAVAASVWAIRELLHGRRDADWIALFAGAFLAASFWHLVLSRYGFRAIIQPLTQALTVAALWRGLRLASACSSPSSGLEEEKSPPPSPSPRLWEEGEGLGEEESPPPSPSPRLWGEGEGLGEGLRGLPWLCLAGFLCGLTVAYTYLAGRAFPIPLAVALLTLLVADQGHRRARLGQLALFVAVTALTIVPMGYYWLTHPGSFLTRTQQVAATSWADVWAGMRACLGMFFLRGDPYIRFNLPYRPLFDPLTAALFLLGVIAACTSQIANRKSHIRNPQSPIRNPQSPVRNLLLAARVFLLANLLVMLLPSVLATGEITPSNLRTVGLLPFIYVFPALALSVIARQISKLANRQIANRKSQIADRKSPFATRRSPFAVRHSPSFFLHSSFFILILAFLTTIAAIAYFRDWAPSVALYEAADGDMVDVARYLNQADLTATTPYVASVHYRHPTLAFLAREYKAIRWLTGGKTVVFPAKGDALLIFPRSASKDMAWVQSVLPEDALVAAPPGPDGNPALRAYRTGPEPGLAPTQVLTANLANVALVMGYDVIGEPRSGESAEVAVWWRVLNVPAAGDYGPIARLADRWGGVWGETEPFRYPSDQWTPGEVVVEHLTIPVALGAPPGDYQVRFSLYSASANSLLSVLDDGGRYAGTSVAFPVYLARAAAPPALDDLSMRTRLDARMGRLTLLGANLDTASARPGERVCLTLFWRAGEAPLPDTEVHLTVGETTLYAGAPVHDTYPTSAWSTGEVVADRYDARLPQEMPPGDWPLRLRLEDPATGVAQGPPLDLGVVTVQATERVFEVPPISHPLSAMLGSRVQLLGYDLSGHVVRPGDALTLTLYWRALAEMDEDYTVFTHLLTAEGAVAGQQDNPPAGGTYPTSLWLAGEVVTDVYVIPVRADAAPGPHRLEVGMYVAETGMRLPVAETSDDSVVLRVVNVTGP